MRLGFTPQGAASMAGSPAAVLEGPLRDVREEFGGPDQCRIASGATPVALEHVRGLLIVSEKQDVSPVLQMAPTSSRSRRSRRRTSRAACPLGRRRGP